MLTFYLSQLAGELEPLKKTHSDNDDFAVRVFDSVDVVHEPPIVIIEVSTYLSQHCRMFLKKLLQTSLCI